MTTTTSSSSNTEDVFTSSAEYAALERWLLREIVYEELDNHLIALSQGDDSVLDKLISSLSHMPITKAVEPKEFETNLKELFKLIPTMDATLSKLSKRGVKSWLVSFIVGPLLSNARAARYKLMKESSFSSSMSSIKSSSSSTSTISIFDLISETLKQTAKEGAGVLIEELKTVYSYEEMRPQMNTLFRELIHYLSLNLCHKASSPEHVAKWRSLYNSIPFGTFSLVLKMHMGNGLLDAMTRVFFSKFPLTISLWERLVGEIVGLEASKATLERVTLDIPPNIRTLLDEYSKNVEEDFAVARNPDETRARKEAILEYLKSSCLDQQQQQQQQQQTRTATTTTTTSSSSTSSPPPPPSSSFSEITEKLAWSSLAYVQKTLEVKFATLLVQLVCDDSFVRPFRKLMLTFQHQFISLVMQKGTGLPRAAQSIQQEWNDCLTALEQRLHNNNHNHSNNNNSNTLEENNTNEVYHLLSSTISRVILIIISVFHSILGSDAAGRGVLHETIEWVIDLWSDHGGDLMKILDSLHESFYQQTRENQQFMMEEAKLALERETQNASMNRAPGVKRSARPMFHHTLKLLGPTLRNMSFLDRLIAFPENPVHEQRLRAESSLQSMGNDEDHVLVTCLDVVYGSEDESSPQAKQLRVRGYQRASLEGGIVWYRVSSARPIGLSSLPPIIDVMVVSSRQEMLNRIRDELGWVFIPRNLNKNNTFVFSKAYLAYRRGNNNNSSTLVVEEEEQEQQQMVGNDNKVVKTTTTTTTINDIIPPRGPFWDFALSEAGSENPRINLHTDVRSQVWIELATFASGMFSTSAFFGLGSRYSLSG
jgi:hypothetical protein